MRGRGGHGGHVRAEVEAGDLAGVGGEVLQAVGRPWSDGTKFLKKSYFAMQRFSS